MKTFYIGVGGIGCDLVMEHKKLNQNPENKYLCFDSEHDIISKYKGKYDFGYWFTLPKYYEMKGFVKFDFGTGAFRNIGRDMFKYVLYSEKILDIPDEFLDEEIKLVFITTTFGGFGSAIVYDLIEYIDARILQRRSSCIIENVLIAINHETYRGYFPYHFRLWTMYELNTRKFVEEYKGYMYRNSMIFPEIKMFVTQLSELERDEYYSVLDYKLETLNHLDIKEKYDDIERPVTQKDVFISYSSQDQLVANMLVSALDKKNIGSWIATESINAGSYAKQIISGIRNAKVFVVIISKDSISSNHVLNEIDQAFNRLKDGIKIMPFIMDDTEMSDECSYYLSRQESFFGDKPPIEEKIDEFVNKILREI